MLNFAEQTGSGAVMLVWSFPLMNQVWRFIIVYLIYFTKIMLSKEVENKNNFSPRATSTTSRVSLLLLVLEWWHYYYYVH